MYTFSSTTPAAPGGNTNLVWQTDGINVSGYVPGSSAPVAIDLTAQTGDISATDIIASAVVGIYSISVYLAVTQAATTSSTLPEVVITWTDADNNTLQTAIVTAPNSGNSLTTYEQGVQIVNAKAGTAIQYATSGTLTSGATPLNYALHIRAVAQG